MKDFLEYMESLNSWHGWDTDRFTKIEMNTVAEIDFTKSPQEIIDYAKHHDLLHHPWLMAFQQAKLTPDAIKIWLRQRYLISWCFTNWLGVVMAKLPTPEARIPILRNLYEEHGLMKGRHHNKPHPQMWQKLFEELEAVDPGSPLPLPRVAQDLLTGTQIYLQLYNHACFRCSSSVGLGAMTFTESILPYENLLILSGLKKLGISKEGQEFFAVHAECDKEHSADFTEAIATLASGTVRFSDSSDSTKILQQVWQGASIAVRARQAFYDGLMSYFNTSNKSILTAL